MLRTAFSALLLAASIASSAHAATVAAPKVVATPGTALLEAANTGAGSHATEPRLGAHAIFGGGGGRNTVHVGEVLNADVHDAGGAKVTAICWSPAPIARPACSRLRTGAPSATGVQRITARLSDGTLLRHSVRVIAAATTVGGPRAVPSQIDCTDAHLFGNVDTRSGHLRDQRATVRRDDRVALYNRLGPGNIFTWSYAQNTGGFMRERCAATPTAQLPRPVHVRLISTGGPFSPVSVVFTTASRIPRVHGTDEQGPHVDAGAGVASNPSIRVSSYGRCYQSFASSYVVKRLHVGRRYPVTIAIGHGAAQRRSTRRVTLHRASLKGTLRHLRCTTPESSADGR